MENNCDVAGDFATVDAICSPEFRAINRELSRIHDRLGLPGHGEFNRRLFPWAVKEHPEARLYATRLWEYPWAISHAKLESGMLCGDVGCGMTAFTPYLVLEKQCRVMGFDPDVVGEGFPKGEFGVHPELLKDSRINFRECGMDALDADDNSLDRVFCISVIEHVPAKIAIRGIQEMARVLKPGGLAIITMDLSVSENVAAVDPLTLIWESGLLPDGELNLTWPVRRLGHLYKRGHSADVYGMVLRKDSMEVDKSHSDGTGGEEKKIERWQIPASRITVPSDPLPLSFRNRLVLAAILLRRGYDEMMRKLSELNPENDA